MALLSLPWTGHIPGTAPMGQWHHWSPGAGVPGQGQRAPSPALRHGVTAPLFLSTHSSCLNHWPNDFRFFPIFLYYYLSLFLLQFSDHELLNVCLLSNSLLPPRHTAACVGRLPAPAPGPSCCRGTPQHAQHMAGPPTLPGHPHTGSEFSKGRFSGSTTAVQGLSAMGAQAGTWGALGCTGVHWEGLQGVLLGQHSQA